VGAAHAQTALADRGEHGVPVGAVEEGRHDVDLHTGATRAPPVSPAAVPDELTDPALEF
jgi:hypothetical protein